MLPKILWILFVSSSYIIADADFWDVRRKLVQDHSGKKGDPKGKYFHESTFNSHYDGRFANRAVPDPDRPMYLAVLSRTFFSTMVDIGVETWIMHGTLLGWWWNQKILPWDSDIDVQVDERTIIFLANYYNMTEYRFWTPETNSERIYLLEVNSHHMIPDQEDTLNVIDARWIDTQTGLFIDISTVRIDQMARSAGIEGALICKDRHHYLESEIYPLRDSFFEGHHVKVPFQYSKLLGEEYGKKALSLTTFARHRWNETNQIWEADR